VVVVGPVPTVVAVPAGLPAGAGAVGLPASGGGVPDDERGPL
jgi:hypothetical protein